ncbi:hypothetical protein APY03_2353 [Variovorax sp. WDL1]|nr:hypothetical protein APY03_2353 [Variovorax sp. WDL1]
MEGVVGWFDNAFVFMADSTDAQVNRFADAPAACSDAVKAIADCLCSISTKKRRGHQHLVLHVRDQGLHLFCIVLPVL